MSHLKTFRPDELQQFLRLLCDSAKEILSQPQSTDESNVDNEA